MKKMLYVFLLVLVYSCETTKDFVKTDITTEFTKEELHSSFVLQTQKVIKLENPYSDALIKDAQRIFCSDSTIFILDRGNNKLLSFDYHGSFLGSTKELIGRAQNEYVHVHDAAFDNINHLIYLYCDIPCQMLILDSNLKSMKCIKMKDLFAEFSLDSQFVYALCPDLTNESHYELRRYKRDNLDGEYEIIKEQKESICRVRGLGKCINGNGKQVYVSMPFDNTIYEIRDGYIKRGWTFDLGGEWFDYTLNKDLKGSRFIDKNDDKHWTIQNIIASDSTILFNTNQSNVFKASLSASNCVGYTNLINDSIPFSSSWMIPTNIKNGVAFLIPSANIMDYKNFYVRRHEEIPSTSISKMIKNTTEKDNPFVIIGTIK